MLKGVFFIVLVMLSANSLSEEFSGTVKALYVNSSNKALVTLKQGDNLPSCAAGLWQFQFDSNTDYGKQWVSMLLASKMSKTQIRVGYTPNAGGYCSVAYVYYLN